MIWTAVVFWSVVMFFVTVAILGSFKILADLIVGWKHGWPYEGEEEENDYGEDSELYGIQQPQPPGTRDTLGDRPIVGEWPDG